MFKLLNKVDMKKSIKCEFTPIFFFTKVAIYFIVYVLTFALVRIYFNREIVFYQGNDIILLLTLIFIFIDYIIVKKIVYLYMYLPVYFSYAILAFSFLSTFPVILDRSITLHMYHYLYLNGPSTEQQIQENFIEEFLIKNNGINKRIQEQVALGNIIVIGDKVQLSNSGIESQKFFSLLNNIFHIKPTYK